MAERMTTAFGAPKPMDIDLVRSVSEAAAFDVAHGRYESSVFCKVFTPEDLRVVNKFEKRHRPFFKAHERFENVCAPLVKDLVMSLTNACRQYPRSLAETSIRNSGNDGDDEDLDNKGVDVEVEDRMATDTDEGDEGDDEATTGCTDSMTEACGPGAEQQQEQQEQRRDHDSTQAGDKDHNEIRGAGADLRFAHAETLVPLLLLLGIRSNGLHPTHPDYRSGLAVMSPFAANLALELFEDVDKSGKTVHFVRFRLNERYVERVPALKEQGANGVVLLDDLLGFFDRVLDDEA